MFDGDLSILSILKFFKMSNITSGLSRISFLDLMIAIENGSEELLLNDTANAVLNPVSC